MQSKNNDKHCLVIEFNVDDMNPQNIPYLLEKVIEAGASDSFVTPIIMKKGRPGYLFTITCSELIEEKILEIIFSESTTIGVRRATTCGVRLTSRSYKTFTSYGEIRVKEIILPSGKKRITPEYEDCRKIIGTENIPLREVQENLLIELNCNENIITKACK